MEQWPCRLVSWCVHHFLLVPWILQSCFGRVLAVCLTCGLHADTFYLPSVQEAWLLLAGPVPGVIAVLCAVAVFCTNCFTVECCWGCCLAVTSPAPLLSICLHQHHRHKESSPWALAGDSGAMCAGRCTGDCIFRAAYQRAAVASFAAVV